MIVDKTAVAADDDDDDVFCVISWTLSVSY